MSKPGLFTSETGKSLLIPFVLVSSLFLLWGLCNALIDTMDKHFVEKLNLSLAQSAWVQFAHYLGYFLMAMPAGWLASKLGYKGGIIAGLLMVAVGGFWFIPATQIAEFWAFLIGVCIIASGLTFLETVANPYTTVLGPPQFAATRINIAQSCNGVGWLLAPQIGAAFFYGKNTAGESTGHETLWIPYAAIGGFVLVLSLMFAFAKLPDIVNKDEFHLEDENDAEEQRSHSVASRVMLWLNIVVLSFAVGMIVSAVAAIPAVNRQFGIPDDKVLQDAFANQTFGVVGGSLALVGTILYFILIRRKVTHHSIWTHPHFSGATLAQFFYVAAQAGIFTFAIFYLTDETPALANSWMEGDWKDWVKQSEDSIRLSNYGATKLLTIGSVCFLLGRVIGAWLLKKYSAHKVLSVFSVMAVVSCALVFLRLGWLSTVSVFLSYFCMSIMFPTIFSLGIHGLGSRAKQASSFIVMAIMGGAIMPKFMGHMGDLYGMSHAFFVPGICFLFVAFYAFSWSKLSGTEGLVGVDTTKGH
jgi:FHS family L-fucose permease-like MFS transporter